MRASVPWVLAFTASSCAPDRPARTCAEGADAVIEAPEAAAWLVRRVRLALEVPASAEVVVDDRVVARLPAAEVHELPIYGRPGIREVRVVLTCDGRIPGEFGPVEVDVGGMPEHWPEIEVLVDRPALREPGLTLVDIGGRTGANWVAAVEADGTPVWVWASAVGKLMRTRLAPDGTVWVLGRDGAAQVDLLGRVLRRWQVAGAAVEGDVPVDASDLHHEVVPVDGGFLTLDNQITAVPAFPRRYAPDAPLEPAELLDPVVLDVADDGTVRRRWALVERLDPQRIGWMSLEPNGGGLDWGHANAVVVDPVDGGLLVSLRHQDAVVKLDPETGEVRWILANPDGWRSPWAELRLAPVGEVAWPYHQHGPMVTANRDGTVDIALFDNGNHGRTTPYSSGRPQGRGSYSRVVVYRVDEAARTVAEVWSQAETSTGPLFSQRYGDADRLPLTGNHLGVWGELRVEGGVANHERDRGAKSVRVVEAAPSGEVVWELSIWGRREDGAEGWQTHGAMRVASLLPL